MRVKLILEYDMGDYPDDEYLPTDLKDWEESFFQSDALIHDMEIVGVKLDETKDT